MKPLDLEAAHVVLAHVPAPHVPALAPTRGSGLDRAWEGTNERRQREVARWPDRRAHAFWSPWDTVGGGPATRGTMTKCERCGHRRLGHAAFGGVPA